MEAKLKKTIDPYLCRQCTELLDRLTKDILSISPWIKIGKQKPKAGYTIMTKLGSVYSVYHEIGQNMVDIIAQNRPETKWMYVPE